MCARACVRVNIEFVHNVVLNEMIEILLGKDTARRFVYVTRGETTLCSRQKTNRSQEV